MRRILLASLLAVMLVFWGCEKPGEEEKEVPTDGTSWEIIHTNHSVLPTLFAGYISSDGQRIFLFGDKGFFAVSTDGGFTWTTDTVADMADSGYSIRCADFADENTGVIGGDMTIYRTTDGGATWTLVASQADFGEARVRKIKYVGNGKFYAIAGANFLRSTDYGATWEVVHIDYLDSTSYGLMSFDFVDEDNGYMITSGPVNFATTDGGLTWIPERTEMGFHGYDVDAADDGTYFVCGDTTKIAYRTVSVSDTDTTVSWTTVPISPTLTHPEAYLLEGMRIEGSLGIAVGNDGLVIISTDGGETWQRTDAPGTYADFSYVALAGDYALAVGLDNIRAEGFATLGTSNLSVWKGVSYGTRMELDDMVFVDEQTGFFVGKELSLFKTYDGGLTLYQRPLVAEHNVSVSGIDFGDDLHGVAVGSDGAIFTTSDGGETWTTVPEENIPYDTDIDHINKVRFVDPTTVYAVGTDIDGNGIFLRSSDAGENWEVIQTGYNIELLNLDFLSPTVGWIVGEMGTVLKTTDGGDTWEQLPTGTNAGLNAVDFIDENHGWACGSFAILKTTDGGQNWQVAQIEDNLFALFHDIVFVDQNTGWIVGDFGYILHTVDGGETWYRQAAGMTESDLYAIYALDATHIWACGELGTILKLVP